MNDNMMIDQYGYKTDSVRNRSSSALSIGSPVVYDTSKYDGISCILPANGNLMSHFAGVLTKALPAGDTNVNKFDGQSSNALAYEGIVYARVLATADCTQGSYLTTYPGAGYLVHTHAETGIVLLTDLSGLTAGTVYTPTSSTKPQIQIMPVARRAKGIPVRVPINNAALETNSYIADGLNPGTDASTATVGTTAGTHLVNQPDVPRNVVIYPGVTNGTDVAAGTSTLSGTNEFGIAITELYTAVANSTDALTGSKMFAAVTSLTFPAQDAGAGTWDVGVGTLLGIGLQCLYDVSLFGSNFDNAADAGTITTGTADINTNAYGVNGTLDGAKDIQLLVIPD